MTAAFGTWGGWAALTAIGTVGAVIVAVGLQWWINYKRNASRPVLSLHFDEHAFVQEKDPSGNTLIPYLRLAVTNETGRRTAEDVELLIERIEEYAISPAGSGGRLVWLANPALAWANSLDPLPRMPIPPGATRYADVACWPDASVPLRLWLTVVPTPGSGRHLLEAGGWRLRLALTARNADATFWDAAVSFEQRLDGGRTSPANVKATVSKVS